MDRSDFRLSNQTKMVRLNNGDSRKSVGEVSRVVTGILIANKYESGAGRVFPGFGLSSLELTFLNSLTSKWIHHALFRLSHYFTFYRMGLTSGYVRV